MVGELPKGDAQEGQAACGRTLPGDCAATAMCAQGRPATPPFSCCCSGELTGIYGNLRNLLTRFTGIHGIYGNLLLPDLREFVCGQHAQMNAHGLLYIGGDGAILY